MAPWPYARVKLDVRRNTGIGIRVRGAVVLLRRIARLHATDRLQAACYLPGIRVKTSPTDFYPIEQVQMMQFTGEKWQLFGPIIDGHAE